MGTHDLHRRPVGRTVSADRSGRAFRRCVGRVASLEFRRSTIAVGCHMETPVIGSLAVMVWGARRSGIHHLADGLVAHRSRSEGFGVLVTRPIAQGELLCVWGGRVVSTARMLRMHELRRRFALQIDVDQYLVTPLRGIGVADLVNHACDPTALLAGADTLVARRDLEPGDEVTYDYATSDANPYFGFACRCGAPQCRAHITGDDWQDRSLHERYGDAFSPYLLRRIRSLGAVGAESLAPSNTGS
jgi:hypothetical protein